MALDNTSLERYLELLCESFEDELERQENVRAVARAQGEAARQHDVATLQARTEALILLMEESVEADKRRKQLLDPIVAHYGLGAEEQSLTGLIAVSPSPWRDRMRRFQEQIKDVVADIQESVRENAVYMRRTLRSLDRSLEALAPPRASGPAYSHEGRELSAAGTGALALDTAG